MALDIGFTNNIGGTFDIAIQFGTMISVIIFYLTDLLGQANALIGRGTPITTAAARRLWIAVAVAFLPAALVGLAFRKIIKQVLYESPTLIAGRTPASKRSFSR